MKKIKTSATRVNRIGGLNIVTENGKVRYGMSDEGKLFIPYRESGKSFVRACWMPLAAYRREVYRGNVKMISCE